MVVQQLLAYANRAAVAAALSERGYEVSRVTVNRWAAGREMPGIAQRMILELFLHSPDTTKEPALDWDGLMDTLDAIAVKVEAMTLDEARERKAHRLVGQHPEELQSPPAPDDVARSHGRTRRTRAEA